MNEIKFAVALNVSVFDYEEVEQVALEYEKLGYYSIWVADHLFYDRDSLLECWTVLSALASVTSKIRLGSLVLCNSYRIPSVMAKMAATLDVISKGRLEFGYGAGWKKDEYVAYGIPFPNTSTRIAQMKEAVCIIKKMWTEEKPTFQGKFYNIMEAYCDPKPVQKPHPPIWIGGAGERLLLKAVAELADGCNIYSRDVGGLEECKHKLEVLKKHCNTVGRNFLEIENSWLGDLVIAKNEKYLRRKIERLKMSHTRYVLAEDGNWILVNIPTEEYIRQNIVGTPEECIAKIEKYLDLGFTYFMLRQTSFSKDDRELFSKEVMKEFK